MCGRFNMLATPEQLIETFGLESVPGYKISYNIAPGQKNSRHCAAGSERP